MKRWFKACISSVLLIVILLSVVVAPIAHAWSYTYAMSVTIADNSGSSRYNIPCLLDISGNALAALGYINSSGNDTDIRIGASSVPSMIASDRIALVIPSLSASGNNTATLYMGYEPEKESFPIIVGEDGYITSSDTAGIELGTSFNVTIDGYYNTDSDNATIVGKDGALRLYGTSGTVTAELTVVETISTNITFSTAEVNYDTVYQTNANYTTAHDAATGINATNVWTAMQYLAASYDIRRAAISVPIPALGAGYEILSARLFYRSDDLADGDVRLLDSDSVTIPLEEAEYGVIGTKTMSDLRGGTPVDLPPSGGYWYINLNASGVAEIVANTSANFTMRATDDINSSAPAGGYHGISVGFGFGDPALEITYTIPQPSIQLNATGVTQGEHKFEIYSNGTTVYFYVDDVLQDSDSISGNNVADTADSYIWMDDNSMPYTNYMAIAVNNTQKLLYQPDSMIVGVTMPDESGNGNDGTITWGANNDLVISGVTGISGGLAVNTYPASNIRTTTATLNGVLTNIGSYEYATVYFEYGFTTDYGYTTGTATLESAGAFSADLSGLLYGNTYHFRAVAATDGVIVYGYDAIFSTLMGAVEGQIPNVLQIVSSNASGARVFSNYMPDTEGDLLFVAEVINTMTPYYPTQSPKEFFTVQLIDTDNTTVLAATPLQYWGDKPASIYVNPTQAASLNITEQYYIRVVGNYEDAPSVQYQLQVSDWKGYDLTRLDDWCIAVAMDMQIYDNTSGYVNVLTDRGEVITDAVAGYFITAIPNIGQVRPNLFETSIIRASLEIGTSGSTWDNVTAWQTNVGSAIATDVTTMATPFGISGKDFLAGVIAIVMVGIIATGTAAMGGFGALGIFLISIPILWLGTYFRIMPVLVLMMLVIFFGLMMIRQFWIKTT